MERVKHEQEKERFPKGENQNKEAFRRWLVREIVSDRMTQKEAIERFDFGVKEGYTLLGKWIKRYSPSIPVTLAKKKDRSSKPFKNRLRNWPSNSKTPR